MSDPSQSEDSTEFPREEERDDRPKINNKSRLQASSSGEQLERVRRRDVASNNNISNNSVLNNSNPNQQQQSQQQNEVIISSSPTKQTLMHLQQSMHSNKQNASSKSIDENSPPITSRTVINIALKQEHEEKNILDDAVNDISSTSGSDRLQNVAEDKEPPLFSSSPPTTTHQQHSHLQNQQHQKKDSLSSIPNQQLQQQQPQQTQPSETINSDDNSSSLISMPNNQIQNNVDLVSQTPTQNQQQQLLLLSNQNNNSNNNTSSSGSGAENNPVGNMSSTIVLGSSPNSSTLQSIESLQERALTEGINFRSTQSFAARRKSQEFRTLELHSSFDNILKTTFEHMTNNNTNANNNNPNSSNNNNNNSNVSTNNNNGGSTGMHKSSSSSQLRSSGDSHNPSFQQITHRSSPATFNEANNNNNNSNVFIASSSPESIRAKTPLISSSGRPSTPGSSVNAASPINLMVVNNNNNNTNNNNNNNVGVGGNSKQQDQTTKQNEPKHQQSHLEIEKETDFHSATETNEAPTSFGMNSTNSNNNNDEELQTTITTTTTVPLVKNQLTKEIDSTKDEMLNKKQKRQELIRSDDAGHSSNFPNEEELDIQKFSSDVTSEDEDSFYLPSGITEDDDDQAWENSKKQKGGKQRFQSNSVFSNSDTETVLKKKSNNNYNEQAPNQSPFDFDWLSPRRISNNTNSNNNTTNSNLGSSPMQKRSPGSVGDWRTNDVWKTEKNSTGNQQSNPASNSTVRI